jgi:NitT/TauT family transport system substrate-binding protein
VRTDCPNHFPRLLRHVASHLAALLPRRTKGFRGYPKPRQPRLLYAAAVAASVTAVTAACASGPGGSGASGGSGGSTATSVTIALPVAEPVQSPVYLASKLGYFRQEGIDAHVVVLASDTAADAALVAGSVQYTSVNAVALITAAEKGVPLQDICTEYNGPAWALAVSQNVLNSTHVSASAPVKQILTALRGTKVAIVGTAVSAPGLILAGLLKQSGLPSDWLSLVGVSGSSDLSGAFSHGEVGAVFDTQPTPDELVQQIPGKVIFSTTQMTALQQIPWEGIVGTKSYVGGNAKVAKGVCAAIGKANNYLLKNPSAAVSQLQSTFPSLSPALLKDAILSYRWSPGAGMTGAQWSSSASLLAQFGLVSKPSSSTLSGLYSTSYLPAG